MPIRTKETAYAVTLERDGTAAAEGNEPVSFESEWTPEHLVLVALARCVVGALRINARRLNIEVAGTAHASGTVGRREEDGSWGFLGFDCRAEVEAIPEPSETIMRALLQKAELGCFVGGSLRPKPVYAWTVNGRELSARAEPS